MQDPQKPKPRILVATDFNVGSERAFYHALAFTVAARAHLTLLHTGPESREHVPWDRFPGVRETLCAWGLLPPDAARSAVADLLDVGVAKMAMRDDSPRLGITDYLRKRPVDLLVMSTEGRAGLARLRHPSVADTVSHLTRSHTLMLPQHSPGFVDPHSGRAELGRVLCALDPGHDPRPALAYLKQWIPVLGGASMTEILLLQLGDDGYGSNIPLPQITGQSWHGARADGPAVDAIIATAREFGPQLVAVNTSSPLGPVARVRGSRNDRLMRELGVPLLAIPKL